uniref:MbcA/ParS/Xre antitoxin family protein n=1 Tax=Burkholderia sp. BCC1985 TaxID=2817442 RepID=UPI002AB14FDD
PRRVAPKRKRCKVVGQFTSKPTVKHARAPTGAEHAFAARSSEVKLMIANAVRREVGRQLRAIVVRRESDALCAVRAYAREVFGTAAKANRWLERPSVRLDGESPVTWLRNHNDPADVYGALDAIAYGTPV